MNFAHIYADKKRFVDLLSEAYEMGGNVERIIYTRDMDNAVELVHIEYPGGHVDRINVTGDSHIAIGMEISRQLYGDGAVGLIR